MLAISCIIFYSKFPVILHYATSSIYYSQNYPQDHCQNNSEALKMILYFFLFTHTIPPGNCKKIEVCRAGSHFNIAKHDYSIGVIIIQPTSLIMC